MLSAGGFDRFRATSPEAVLSGLTQCHNRHRVHPRVVHQFCVALAAALSCRTRPGDRPGFPCLGAGLTGIKPATRSRAISRIRGKRAHTQARSAVCSGATSWTCWSLVPINDRTLMPEGFARVSVGCSVRYGSSWAHRGVPPVRVSVFALNCPAGRKVVHRSLVARGYLDRCSPVGRPWVSGVFDD